MSLYFNDSNDFEDLVERIKSYADDLQEKYDDLERENDSNKEEVERLESELDDASHEYTNIDEDLLYLLDQRMDAGTYIILKEEIQKILKERGYKYEV
jgi:chromosome segregation ATPase